MIAALALADGVAEVRFTGRADGDLGLTTAADATGSREALRKSLKLDGIAGATQVHGNAIAVVADLVSGYVLATSEADGAATNLRSVGVAVHVADCLPIAVAGRGGVVMLHGGWRGLAAGVVANGVAALRRLGVSGPLEAAIGPGAGGCCYETGEEVHAAFGRSVPADRRLDLKGIADDLLRAAGVAKVADVGICTLCAPAGLLYSHRRDGAATGRQAGIAWLS